MTHGQSLKTFCDPVFVGPLCNVIQCLRQRGLDRWAAAESICTPNIGKKLIAGELPVPRQPNIFCRRKSSRSGMSPATLLSKCCHLAALISYLQSAQYLSTRSDAIDSLMAGAQAPCTLSMWRTAHNSMWALNLVNDTRYAGSPYGGRFSSVTIMSCGTMYTDTLRP